MKLRFEKRRIDAFSVCYVVFFVQLNLILHSFTFFSDTLTSVIYLFMRILFAGAIIWCAIRNYSRIIYALIIPLLILALYYITSARLGNDFHYVSDALQENLFFQCVPAYFCAFLIEDYSGFKVVLKRFSYLLFIGGISIVLLQIAFGARAYQVNYLNLSYCLTVPFVYFLLTDNKKKAYVFFLIVDAIFILFFGGRSAVLCIAIALIYRLVFMDKNRSLWIAGIGVAGFVLFFVYDNIIRWIVTASSSYGITGGIQKYYSMGNIFYDSGRGSINEASRAIININPYFGAGLGADRYYLGQYGFQYGWYPHNFFYELLIDFGIVIGVLIFLYIVIQIIRVLFGNIRCGEMSLLLKIYIFTGGFLVLLFSNSYLRSPMFFSMLAFMIRNRVNLKYAFKKTDSETDHRNNYGV